MGFFDFFEKPQPPQEEQAEAEKSPREYKSDIEDIFLRRKQIEMDRVSADKSVEEKLDNLEAEIKEKIGEELYEELLEEIKSENSQDMAA